MKLLRTQVCCDEGYGTCSHRGGGGGSSVQDRCRKCIACLKNLCHYHEDVSLIQLLGVLYRVLVAAVFALVALVLAILPVAKFFMFLSLYIPECIEWTLQEHNLFLCIAKGIFTLVLTVCLGYVAWILMHTLLLPILRLISTVVCVLWSYL